MRKYRRIEVKAFRQRVDLVSGEWRHDLDDSPPAQTDDGVTVNYTDPCEPVEPDSPEGQLILVEALRSLERQLSPETRALMCAGPTTLPPHGPNRNRLYLKLRSFYGSICAGVLGLTRKEK